MATYFCWTGASGANNGSSWTDAYTTLTAALAAATASGDVVKMHYTSQDGEAVSTWTVPSGVSIICVDKDNSDIPTPMGTSGWIGAASSTKTLTSTGCFVYGLTLYISGTGNATMSLFQSDGSQNVMEECLLWLNNTGGGSQIVIGQGDGGSGRDFQSHLELRRCTVRFGAVTQSLRMSGNVTWTGGGISTAGSAPNTFVYASRNATELKVFGADFSVVTGTFLGSSNSGRLTATLSLCSIGSGMVPLASQTPANMSGSEIMLLDCAAGDTHGLFGYYNAFGSVVSDTGIFFTSGAAGQSWKVTTTANASLRNPFQTPFFGYYNTALSAVTPYIEILRDGSATAYQDDEVWINVLAKVTASSTEATLFTDRMTFLGAPANQAAGAGLGSWTGEGGTAWSGKIGLGSSITPAEVGYIQARIVVGEPSITVYADPQIRV